MLRMFTSVLARDVVEDEHINIVYGKFHMESIFIIHLCVFRIYLFYSDHMETNRSQRVVILNSTGDISVAFISPPSHFLLNSSTLCTLVPFIECKLSHSCDCCCESVFFHLRVFHHIKHAQNTVAFGLTKHLALGFAPCLYQFLFSQSDQSTL